MSQEPVVTEFISAPRRVPRTISCLIYSVMSVGIIAAVVATLMSNSRNQQHRKKFEDGSIDFRKYATTEVTSPVFQLFSPAVIREHDEMSKLMAMYKMTKRPKVEHENDADDSGLIKLEEVVGYECHQTGIKNYKWVEGSNHVVYFLNSTGHRWTVNIESNRTAPPGPTQDLPRRHLSAIWRCSSSSCRFHIRLSSAVEASPLKFGESVVQEVAKLALGRPADFVLVRELTGGLLKRKLSVWLAPVDNETSYATNSCTRKLSEEYAFEWDEKHMKPKYAVLVSETCQSHQLARKDEFTFDPVYPTSKKSPIESTMTTKAVPSSTNGSRAAGACDGSCEGSVNKTSQLTNSTASSGFWKDWSEKSVNSRKRRSLDENDSFEYLRLGDSSWVLHTVVKRIWPSSVLSLAVSELEVVLQDLRPDWIPVADEKRYRTVLGDDLYVTKVLGTIANVDEAIVYFLAAPVLNFSRRYLYKIKIIYSNNLVNFGPSECLTCIEANEAANVLGKPPQCGWTEARMSYSGRNYILDCKGPDPPWTSVVSSQDNLVIHQLQKSNDSYLKPSRVEFEVLLKGGIRTQARLHLPRKCNGRLLLGLSDRQAVTDRYDLSLADYLASVKGYAVLHADVRGSRFLSLDMRRVRLRRRQIMQVRDYARVTRRAIELAEGCVNDGFLGVYGGHVALNVMGTKGFRCGAVVKPARASKTGDRVPGKRARRRHLLDLVRRLRDKKFALFSFHPDDYIGELLELSSRLRVNLNHRVLEDDDCSGKLKLYQEMSDFFDSCFGS